ncbi:LysR family transcriptional regulator [Streptomyces sp. M19]
MVVAEDLDLNLLRVFDALMDTGSVAEAAVRLHLSAPATSRALGRLRRAMNDPILVRAGQGLVPTPFAQRSAARVKAVLDAAAELRADSADSDPGPGGAPSPSASTTPSCRSSRPGCSAGSRRTLRESNSVSWPRTPRSRTRCATARSTSTSACWALRPRTSTPRRCSPPASWPSSPRTPTWGARHGSPSATCAPVPTSPPRDAASPEDRLTTPLSGSAARATSRRSSLLRRRGPRDPRRRRHLPHPHLTAVHLAERGVPCATTRSPRPAHRRGRTPLAPPRGRGPRLAMAARSPQACGAAARLGPGFCQVSEYRRSTCLR